jgi:Uma2 family endonuclease
MSGSTQAAIVADMEYPPMVVHLQPAVKLSGDQFFDFCRVNRDLRIERNEHGELIIMPPAGSETGNRNLEIAIQLGNWAKRDGTGKAFDSSSGFTLPNGAVRSPDAAWLQLSKWKSLTARQRRKFAPLCPDFVIELRSPADSLKALQAKMREYRTNGAELGLLIDPEERRVHIYRRGRKVQVQENPETVACDPVLPGFVLDLREIW